MTLERETSATRGAWRTTGEVARRFGVKTKAVRRWCEAGRFPALRTPAGRYLIHDRVIDVLLGLAPMPFPTLSDLFGEPSKPSP